MCCFFIHSEYHPWEKKTLQYCFFFSLFWSTHTECIFFSSAFMKILLLLLWMGEGAGVLRGGETLPMNHSRLLTLSFCSFMWLSKKKKEETGIIMLCGSKQQSGWSNSVGLFESKIGNTSPVLWCVFVSPARRRVLGSGYCVLDGAAAIIIVFFFLLLGGAMKWICLPLLWCLPCETAIPLLIPLFHFFFQLLLSISSLLPINSLNECLTFFFVVFILAATTACFVVTTNHQNQT